MLSVFASTEHIPAIREWIRSEYRLDELVSVTDLAEQAPQPSGYHLVADAGTLDCPLDWHNSGPPYLYPRPLPLNKALFMGLLFGKLGNLDRAARYLSGEPALLHDFSLVYALQNSLPVRDTQLAATESAHSDPAFESYRLAHNAAISRHYGNPEKPAWLEQLEAQYTRALTAAPDDEYRAFTARHYATLLLDAGALSEAAGVLETHLVPGISTDATYALKALLSSVWMKQLAVPYDQHLIGKIKEILWDTLQYYEQQDLHPEAALLLVDASEIANISGSYAESLGYINRAISIFEREMLTGLLGSACIRKGTLLYTWAQNGNPQFYRGALQAYQEALKIYRQDQAPEIFADIHHKLGVIYSEMPDDNKKRQIWAAVSATSFREALQYYTRETHPYEYAMICNNYANALTRYPTGMRADNYARAVELYTEALEIRTADYPYERAITLLNYLEACWHLSDEPAEANGEWQRKRLEEMVRKAEEVKQLVGDETLIAEADAHLAQLAELKKVLV